MEVSPKIITKKENKEITHSEIQDLFEPIKKIVESLKDKIEAGEYQYIIGDDASGRIPALVFHGLIKKICEERNFSEPKLYFLAGSGRRSTHLEKKEKASKLNYYIGSVLNNPELSDIDDKGKVLIVTDTIDTGSSLKPLTSVLKKQKLEFDIATIAFLDANIREGAKEEMEEYLEGKITYATGDVPRIYERKEMGLAGVHKDQKDVLSKRIDTANSSKVIKLSREDVKILVDQLYDWYKENFKISDGDTFAESQK